MTILVYDTETTGLPVWKAPSSDPQQPHLVEISIGVFADNGDEIDVGSMIIRPDGWTIPADMTAIHGIAQDHALDVGVPLAHAVGAYTRALQAASVRVAHNESFDRRIMRIAMMRAGMSRQEIEQLEARPAIDTCREAAAWAKIAPSDHAGGRDENVEIAEAVRMRREHFRRDARRRARRAARRADVRAAVFLAARARRLSPRAA